MKEKKGNTVRKKEENYWEIIQNKRKQKLAIPTLRLKEKEAELPFLKGKKKQEQWSLLTGRQF